MAAGGMWVWGAMWGLAGRGVAAGAAGAARGMASGSVGKRGLSPKRSAKGYYKGKGVQATGRHTKHGRYQILKRKLPVYVAPAPGAGDAGLRPYVAPNSPKLP